MKRSPLKRLSPLRSNRGTFAPTGKMVECAAPDCDREFYRQPAELRKFCSRDCWRRHVPPRSPEGRARMQETMRATRQGSGNPAFKTGARVGERAVYKAFNLALKGERVCRVCGGDEWMALHHAVPRGLGPPESKTNLLNGLPLCGRHHAGWHHRRVTIYRDVFRPDEWAYLSGLVLTGREVGPWLDERYPTRPRVYDPATVRSLDP